MIMIRDMYAPWFKKGVDLTDYFNYGLGPDTWQLYAQKQLDIRAHFKSSASKPPPPWPPVKQ